MLWIGLTRLTTGTSNWRFCTRRRSSGSTNSTQNIISVQIFLLRNRNNCPLIIRNVTPLQHFHCMRSHLHITERSSCFHYCLWSATCTDSSLSHGQGNRLLNSVLLRWEQHHMANELLRSRLAASSESNREVVVMFVTSLMTRAATPSRRLWELLKKAICRDRLHTRFSYVTDAITNSLL